MYLQFTQTGNYLGIDFKTGEVKFVTQYQRMIDAGYAVPQSDFAAYQAAINAPDIIRAADSEGSGSETTYLGQVATRCRLSLGKYGANAGQWIQYKSMHWSKDKIINPIVVIPHFYVSTANVESVVSGGNIKLAIEYPVGVFTLSNENIANGNAAVATGAGISALNFTITIPKNAQFWVRGLEINDAGPVYGGYPNGPYNQPASEGFESGTSAPTDKTTSGTIAPGDGFAKQPLLILAKTINPAVLIVGDSRAAGGNEGTYDGSGDVGEVARSIGRGYGYCSFALSSSRLDQYNAATRTYRDQIVSGTVAGANTGVSYFTVIVNAYGINDLFNGATVSTLTARRVAFAALYPSLPVIGTTLTPNATTTDGYATTTNQTPTNTWPNIRDFNEAVRTGLAGEKGYWDVASAVDPDRRGVFPASRNLTAAARNTACTFTASISGTTLTVSAITSGSLALGDPITDNTGSSTGLATSTVILAQLTGTAGSTGTYRLNNSQTKASRTMYVGGFATNDGTHINAQLSEVIRDSGVINLELLKR